MLNLLKQVISVAVKEVAKEIKNSAKQEANNFGRRVANNLNPFKPEDPIKRL